MNTIGYEVLNSFHKKIYVPVENRKAYTGKDFIQLAKGNLKYAEALFNRVSWQLPETVMSEDFKEGEIIEIEDQIVMTNGKDFEVIENE